MQIYFKKYANIVKFLANYIKIVAISIMETTTT